MHSPPVVEIALEQISYGVDEADGPVEVCVVIVSGTLEREASVEVELSDISAGSKSHVISKP